MQQKFLILGIPVYTRRLPSGDMTVWHPYNANVRIIVEPICRGRGYWRDEFNNWIIKANCTKFVLEELANIGMRL